MSEPSHLVPNLNKMMEEYAEGEEESVQATPSGIGREGERTKVRVENEQTTKETIK